MFSLFVSGNLKMSLTQILNIHNVLMDPCNLYLGHFSQNGVIMKKCFQTFFLNLTECKSFMVVLD
jgi:hypothetical protein